MSFSVQECFEAYAIDPATAPVTALVTTPDSTTDTTNPDPESSDLISRLDCLRDGIPLFQMMHQQMLHPSSTAVEMSPQLHALIILLSDICTDPLPLIETLATIRGTPKSDKLMRSLNDIIKGDFHQFLNSETDPDRVRKYLMMSPDWTYVLTNTDKPSKFVRYFDTSINGTSGIVAFIELFMSGHKKIKLKHLNAAKEVSGIDWNVRFNNGSTTCNVILELLQCLNSRQNSYKADEFCEIIDFCTDLIEMGEIKSNINDIKEMINWVMRYADGLLLAPGHIKIRLAFVDFMHALIFDLIHPTMNTEFPLDSWLQIIKWSFSCLMLDGKVETRWKIFTHLFTPEITLHGVLPNSAFSEMETVCIMEVLKIVQPTGDLANAPNEKQTRALQYLSKLFECYSLRNTTIITTALYKLRRELEIRSDPTKMIEHFYSSPHIVQFMTLLTRQLPIDETKTFMTSMFNSIFPGINIGRIGPYLDNSRVIIDFVHKLQTTMGFVQKVLPPTEFGAVCGEVVSWIDAPINQMLKRVDYATIDYEPGGSVGFEMLENMLTSFKEMIDTIESIDD
jgi:hypothetical protein